MGLLEIAEPQRSSLADLKGRGKKKVRAPISRVGDAVKGTFQSWNNLLLEEFRLFNVEFAIECYSWRLIGINLSAYSHEPKQPASTFSAAFKYSKFCCVWWKFCVWTWDSYTYSTVMGSASSSQGQGEWTQCRTLELRQGKEARNRLGKEKKVCVSWWLLIPETEVVSFSLAYGLCLL